MAEESVVKAAALKRLHRELKYHRSELSTINAKLAGATDDYETKKFNEMVAESHAVMRMTRAKMATYAQELAELGAEVDPEILAAIKEEL